MTLDELLGTGGDLEISALAYDDRRVAPGTLFFCVPGFTRDGHDFAPAAVERGAVALVVSRRLDLDVPQVRVDDVRDAMALAAARLHGDPSASLPVVGITGTNGKTTCAHLVRAILEAAGRPTGLLGTVGTIVGGGPRDAVRTTPEAIDLQPLLAEMLRAGDRACAMEVSSHALELRRVQGIAFAVALFTNLTQDHLDFHPDMEAYFAAKRRLFAGTPRAPGAWVANLDDPYGRRLAEAFPGTVTYAVDAPDADYRATDLHTGFAGSDFVLERPDGPAIGVLSPLPGRFNVANVLGAIACARALEVEIETVVRALADAGRVPGRFEPVVAGQGYAVLVDYAHTPDGLENVLRAARDLVEADGRVLCVFGCGGDRDRAKRPLMGEIALRLADVALVTSDNPRSEDPDAIVAEVVAGRDGFVVEVDRRAAIGLAVGDAAPGDVVVIAGKGHEQGQERAGGRVEPFDDATVAREALERSLAPPALRGRAAERGR